MGEGVISRFWDAVGMCGRRNVLLTWQDRKLQQTWEGRWTAPLSAFFSFQQFIIPPRLAFFIYWECGYGL